MSWTKEDIAFILKTFDGSAANEFSMDDHGMKLSMKKALPGAEGGNVRPQTAMADMSVMSMEQTLVNSEAQSIPQAQLQQEAAQQVSPSKPEKEGYSVKAALAGIFYRASSPESKPYVTEGTKVKKGDVIGLIEAMKIMSEIPSPVDGTVRHISVENGTFIQFNTELMTIEEA